MFRLMPSCPIIDLEELLDEAKERIEEKLIIEGGFQAAFYIG